MHATNRANLGALGLFAAVLATALLATATPASAGESAAPQPATKPAAPAHWVGVFTGEYENGAPVYRLPPITVVANRKVELAKMAQEDKLARARTARPKVSPQRSAATTDQATLALSARDQ